MFLVWILEILSNSEPFGVIDCCTVELYLVREVILFSLHSLSKVFGLSSLKEASAWSTFSSCTICCSDCPLYPFLFWFKHLKSLSSIYEFPLLSSFFLTSISTPTIFLSMKLYFLMKKMMHAAIMQATPSILANTTKLKLLAVSNLDPCKDS